jgi:hypothetical protein
MQFKFLATIALATLAVAIPNNPPPATSSDKCCSQVVAASNPAAALLLGVLGIAVQDVVGAVGLDCTVGLIFIYRNIFA